jgi:hypothetical protein
VVVVASDDVKLTVLNVLPLQTVWLVGPVTEGNGSTVTGTVVVLVHPVGMVTVTV